MFIQRGDNSHPRGISAAWPGPDGKLNAVLLDTAGTNQPVNQSGCMTMECVASKIWQRRVSDKFVLDVAHAIANKQIMVVNRMSAASAVRRRCSGWCAVGNRAGLIIVRIQHAGTN